MHWIDPVSQGKSQRSASRIVTYVLFSTRCSTNHEAHRILTFLFRICCIPAVVLLSTPDACEQTLRYWTMRGFKSFFHCCIWIKQFYFLSLLSLSKISPLWFDVCNRWWVRSCDEGSCWWISYTSTDKKNRQIKELAAVGQFLSEYVHRVSKSNFLHHLLRSQ